MDEIPRNQHPIMHPNTPFDVPGYIRKVRRVRDLSQRELALRMSVSQATVARWETGEIEPSISTFRRLLALAEWDLEVMDDKNDLPASMSPHAVRDRQGRRCPAHLDVQMSHNHAPPSGGHPGRHWWVPGRGERDWHRRKAQGFVPHDHPHQAEVDEFVWAMEWQRGAHQRRWLARWRARQSVRPDPECECQDPCFVADHCVPGCACGCEVRGEERPPHWSDPPKWTPPEIPDEAAGAPRWRPTIDWRVGRIRECDDWRVWRIRERPTVGE
ncbi:helix-turn-helix domain-containing protein [Granulicoccus sp. GXG6511]|uniref:helix-turn-helix domain-containing protein n=1 Tax=Granulicoccus sp. GXG6511 TaxID=3381351 RepID=UPI003D7DEBE5